MLSHVGFAFFSYDSNLKMTLYKCDLTCIPWSHTISCINFIWLFDETIAELYFKVPKIYEKLPLVQFNRNNGIRSFNKKQNKFAIISARTKKQEGLSFYRIEVLPEMLSFLGNFFEYFIFFQYSRKYKDLCLYIWIFLGTNNMKLTFGLWSGGPL